MADGPARYERVTLQDQAEPHWTERLRAQLALRELRRYRKERLGRWPAHAEHDPGVPCGPPLKNA